MTRMAMILSAPVLLVLLSGCPAPSVNPLSDSTKAQPDPRLAGVWHGRMKDVDTYLHIAASEGAWMDVIQVTHDKKLSTDMYLAFPTNIGDRSYLNFSGPPKGDAHASYYFFSYSVSDNDLKLTWLDESAAGELIKAGKLKGDSKGDSVTITDDSDKIAEALKGGDHDKLFPKDNRIEFKRVK